MSLRTVFLRSPWPLYKKGLAVTLIALVLAGAPGLYFHFAQKTLVESRLKTAAALIKSGNFTGAEHELLAAITAGPENADAYCALADYYRSVAQPQTAAACLLKLRQVSPTFPHVVCRLAICAEDSRKHLEAYALAQDELKRDPDCYRALDLLSTLDQKTGEKRKADEEAAHAYRTAPKDEQAVVLYARTFLPENIEHTIKILSEAQSSLPDSWSIAYLLGWCYGHSAQDSKGLTIAEQQLRRAERLRPDQGSVHRELCDVLLLEKRFNEAVEEGSLAVRFEPYGVSNYAQYEKSLRSIGRQKEAEQVDRKYRQLQAVTSRSTQLVERLKNAPNDPVVTHQFAEVCEQLGNPHLALVMVQSALAAHPSDPQLKKDLDRLTKDGVR